MMKLFEFIAGVVLIWFVFRAVRRGSRPVGPARQARGPSAAERMEAAQSATETIRCRRCGSYVPADHPAACERPDCPFPKAG